MCEARSAPRMLLDQIRQVGASEWGALDAATAVLSDREKVLLADQLTRVATQIATRVGYPPDSPPPEVLPGSDSGRLALTVQPAAVLAAALFVRNTLHRWGWADLLVDAEYATRELTTAFVTAVAAAEYSTPTRMVLRLRALSRRRLVVELRDSPGNADLIATSEYLLSTHLQRISVHSGRCCTAGRTVLWCELARPELSRWI